MATKKPAKKAVKKVAAATPAPPLAKAPRARVLMYRQGLGDCFLIGFPKTDGETFWVMIDCGVVLGTADAKDQMDKVVEHIIRTTNGAVDILVATHEHWDHVSGFAQSAALFTEGGAREAGKLAVKKLWLAWTEDEKHPLATKIRRDRVEKLQALRAAS
ncbi:MAG: MBL fold metallo-hydrolase, partial [Bryobacterales bacterium]|nr:MBL fold metallo-hydrolase [Bryobacterales bacterium]